MTGGAVEKPPRLPISHVIFDLDGLLLNTEIFYTQIISEYASRFGKEYTWELKQQMMGRKEHESAKLAIDYMGLPITAEEYVHHVHEVRFSDFFKFFDFLFLFATQLEENYPIHLDCVID